TITAEFTKQIQQLSLFAHLNEDWFEQLERIIDALKVKRNQQMESAVHVLHNLVTQLCTYQESQKVLTEAQAKSIQSILKTKFEKEIVKLEREAIQSLLSTYGHQHTNLEVDNLDLPPDLFDQDQWYMWGLNKKQLVAAASLAGAVSGAALDAAVAGHSFMLGALGGGIIGATSAFFGADKITELKIKGLPLGGYVATYGPIKNRNFPYVIIGRFLYCYQQISQLSHANRNALKFSSTDFQAVVTNLEKKQQKELHQACRDLSNQKENNKLEIVLNQLFTHIS
ncbi:MAG: DUF3482 domain-containing protein, partial [Gammaproteobacteria bacterium]|nr:DUF3482 domain-containing protein [Gammaproteobacteria bacterium]